MENDRDASIGDIGDGSQVPKSAAADGKRLTQLPACAKENSGDGDETQEMPGTDGVSSPPTCQVIGWFSEGESRTVQVGDVAVEIRMVARAGRRARIAIKAPAGAVFSE
jgi:hypothetical protein